MPKQQKNCHDIQKDTKNCKSNMFIEMLLVQMTDHYIVACWVYSFYIYRNIKKIKSVVNLNDDADVIRSAHWLRVNWIKEKNSKNFLNFFLRYCYFVWLERFADYSWTNFSSQQLYDSIVSSCSIHCLRNFKFFGFFFEIINFSLPCMKH